MPEVSIKCMEMSGSDVRTGTAITPLMPLKTRGGLKRVSGASCAAVARSATPGSAAPRCATAGGQPTVTTIWASAWPEVHKSGWRSRGPVQRDRAGAGPD